MNLKEAIEKYIVSRSKRLADNSIKTYRRVLERLAEFVGGDKPLGDITDEDIDAFQVDLKAKVGVNTQINYAAVLRAFFKYWVARKESFVIYQAIEGPRRIEHHPNFITPEQFEAIDARFRADEYYQLMKKLIFNLLWDTGMRVGELVGLDIADIAHDKNYVVLHTEKSKKLRMLVWSERTHALLLKYLGTRLCLNQAPELFQTPSRSRMRRTRLTTRSIQRWCQELSRELGFRINPHAFRHGKMHAVINAGGNRQHVQAIAGHSNIGSSEVYVRLNEQEQLRIQERFLEKRPRIKQNSRVKPSPYSWGRLA